MYPGVRDLFLTATPVTKCPVYLPFPFWDGDYGRICRENHGKNIREAFRLPVSLQRRCTLSSCTHGGLFRGGGGGAGQRRVLIALFSFVTKS